MAKRTLFVLPIALLTTVALAAAQQQPKMSKEVQSLQGNWTFTSNDGQDMAGTGTEIIVTITGNNYVQAVNGQIVERGSFTLDPSKKPMALDLSITEGENAGTHRVGVLEITGNMMRGKLNAPGATARPTDFAPVDGYSTFSATKK